MPALIYKIYYGNTVAYLGRTCQPLQNRIRGHVFGKPMHRKIDIFQVSKIEYAKFSTVADMYLYEIYFINKLKPPLNRDDKASDELSVTLPEPEWHEFTTHLWDKWKAQIEEDNSEEKRLRKECNEFREQLLILRREHAAGRLSADEYWARREALETSSLDC